VIHLSDFLNLVGHKIRTIRKAKDFTQEELAEKAGLQYSYIGGVERGERNVSLETLEKIIEGLGITPYELFKLEESDINSSMFDKKRKIEGINNLLIDRNAQEIEMIFKLIKDIVNIIDTK
jgi:transcriptional regulator with XRE-family HTH domain